jgi:hypothetical protein
MTNQNKNNQIIVYTTKDGETKIEVRVEGETVWQLFGNSEQLSM